MTLIVEDGSVVTDANTYVSLADAEAYLAARGITPTTADDIEAMIITAMDYLESFESRFKGSRTDRDQPLSWPRSGAVIEDWTWTSSEIPRQVISAQLSLVLEIYKGEDPFNPSADLPVVRERVEGAVEVEYANPGQVLKVSKAQPSKTHINLLLKNSGLFAVRA